MLLQGRSGARSAGNPHARPREADEYMKDPMSRYKKSLVQTNIIYKNRMHDEVV